MLIMSVVIRNIKTQLLIRPVRRILKTGVQSTVWPIGHDEGEGAGGEAFTLWMI